MRPDGYSRPYPNLAKFLLLGSCLLWGAGCVRDFGAGGTGETVVPRRTLREVETLDLERLSVPVTPTTEPSTRPATVRLASTRPTGGPADAPSEVSLTLADVRRIALENNLDLKVELLNPSIARTSLTEEQARYEALFTTNASYSKTDSPTATQLEGSQANSLNVDPGLEIPLRTGGRLRFGLPVNRFETNNQFSTLNPAFSSDAAVTLSQPLLRGFGFFVNAQPIRVAFYQYQSAQARTKLQVIRVLTDVEREYWRLYAVRQALAVRVQEYELAVAQLERARRRERIGAGAEPDVIRAESGVADRVDAIIGAENVVRDEERLFKRLLNHPDLDVGSPTIVNTATEPTAMPYRLDPHSLARAALDGRMELLEEELRIAQETANVRVARNDLLPLVSLEYTYNIGGLGPTLDDSLSQVREKRFEDHRVGVRLEVPIGNEAARSRLERAILSRLQRLATRDQRELQIRQEVYDAVDELDANWQRILAARRRVIAAARVVDLETRQNERGLRTSTDVLDAQANLASAKLSEIQAVANYQIAQVDIAFATGTVLGASKVVWQPTVAPDRATRN